MRRSAWLLAVVAILVTVSGCQTKAQRRYRLAESFFAEGKYQLAQAEYQKIVDEHGRDPLGEAAMYKIAYINREVYGDLPRAAWWYQRLADQYPESSYADDALLWVMEIQARRLGDLAAARSALREIRRRFPSSPDICGRAQIALASLLMRRGNHAEASALCRRAIQEAREYPHIASSAALLLAKTAQRAAAQPLEALPLFEAVVRNYPDTAAAVEAKQVIGLHYYEVKARDEQQTRLEQAKRARVLAGVPTFGVRAGPALGNLLGALRSLLAQAGLELSEDEIWGISGAAFQFLFDASDPGAGARLCQENPLTTVAEELGYTYGVWAPGADTKSLITIEQALQSSRPVLILYGGGAPDWTLVTGYEPAANRLHSLRPGGRQAVPVSVDEFLRTWKATPSGPRWTPATRQGFQFVLSSRGGIPDAQVVARHSLARAVRLLDQRSASGAPAGRAGYQALVTTIRRAGAPDGGQAWTALGQWAGPSLNTLAFSRGQAAAYLGRIKPLFEGLGAQAIGSAQGRYGRAQTAWGELGAQIRKAIGDGDQAQGTWSQLATSAQRICDEEIAALDELGAVVRRL